MSVKITDLPLELIGRITFFLDLEEQDELVFVSKVMRKGVRLEQYHYIDKVYNNSNTSYVSLFSYQYGHLHSGLIGSLYDRLFKEIGYEIDNILISFFHGNTITINGLRRSMGPFDCYFLYRTDTHKHFPTIRLMKISGNYGRKARKLYPRLIRPVSIMTKSYIPKMVANGMEVSPEYIQLPNFYAALEEFYSDKVIEEPWPSIIQETFNYIKEALNRDD